MSIEISRETEAQLSNEALRQGISVKTLLERLLNEWRVGAIGASRQIPELPLWHLGGSGDLHRRDIYDDGD